MDSKYMHTKHENLYVVPLASTDHQRKVIIKQVAPGIHGSSRSLYIRGKSAQGTQSFYQRKIAI